MAKITFTIEAQTTFGDALYIVGNNSALGNWDPHKGLPLSTNSTLYPHWKATIDMDNILLKYKYVIIKKSNEIIWESSIQDREISVQNDSIEVDDFKFNDISHRIIKGACTPIISHHLGDTIQIKPVHKKSGADDLDKYRNYDSYQNTIINDIIKFNSTNSSWLSKLECTFSILDSNYQTSNSLTVLSLIAAYLYFIHTGQLPTNEEGSHMRPNHHAKISLDIYQKLRTIEKDKEAFFIRLIYKHLPSYNSTFLVPVPLTKIRDIAHRNDIPSDLKLEIKKTLQNKLHRCAGPEDLQTALAIYEKMQKYYV